MSNMLDLHQLKLKYREMSSQYSQGLTKPVFKTSKRSYTHLKIGQQADGLGKIHLKQTLPGTAEKGSDVALRVPVGGELLGETASRLRKDTEDIAVGDDDAKQGGMTETFQQLPQVQHKFMPQYKVEALTQREGAPHVQSYSTTGRVNENSDLQGQPPVTGSHDKLMQLMQ